MLTVSDAVLLSDGQVTVTVTGTGPGCCPAVHVVERSAGCARVPVGAVQRYVTGQLIESVTVAVTVDVLPTSTVHGSHAALTVKLCTGAGGGAAGGGGGGGGRGWGGRRWRRRRYVDLHARVIPDAELPDVVVAELVGVGEAQIARLRRDVPADAGAGEEAVLRLVGQAERRARDVLGVRDRRRDGQVGAAHRRPG